MIRTYGNGLFGGPTPPGRARWFRNPFTTTCWKFKGPAARSVLGRGPHVISPSQKPSTDTCTDRLRACGPCSALNFFSAAETFYLWPLTGYRRKKNKYPRANQVSPPHPQGGLQKKIRRPWSMTVRVLLLTAVLRDARETMDEGKKEIWRHPVV